MNKPPKPKASFRAGLRNSLIPTSTSELSFDEKDWQLAVNILHMVFQEQGWQAGEIKIPQNRLVELVAAENIHRVLALALIENLVVSGVIQQGKMMVDLTIFVSFGGRQRDIIKPNPYLHISKATWLSYLAARKKTCSSSLTPPQYLPGSDREGTTSSRVDRECQALALMFKHPEWNFAQIAQGLGVHCKTLYKWPKFREAAAMAGKLKSRGPKEGSIPRGHKCKGLVEAYARDSSDE